MRNDEDSLEDLLRDAVRTYNAPPEEREMPLGEIWRAIDEEHFGRGVGGRARTFGWGALVRHGRIGRRLWDSQAVRIAAAVVVGIGIGRVSYLLGGAREARGTSSGGQGQMAPAAIAERTGATRPVGTVASATSAGTAGTAARHETTAAAVSGGAMAVETTRYLGQTAALLSALPGDAGGARPDTQFIGRARELLLTTRLLLDSPVATTPAQRTLLEDLEVVLAQVVRLRSGPDASSGTELELIHQALEQRDVLLRLKSAAGD